MRGRSSEVGETRVSKNGYHYTRTEEGWRLTHRVVYEQFLGRELLENERVVFIDGDRNNIALDNLIVAEVRYSTIQKKRAILQAKLDELNAELESLDTQVT